jgi:general L-amino acid transport system substrate-binding protein
VVAKTLGIKELGELAGKSVCILRGTPYRTRIEEWFAERKQTIAPVMFDAQDDMYKAFFAGQCVAITQDISPLAATIIAGGRAADYVMLPEIIAKDPLAAYVRAGDDQWLDVVRWTHFALVEAEERGITQANVDDMRDTTEDVGIKQFLGVEVEGDDGSLSTLDPGLGLPVDFAYQVIKQVGNYGEIFDRSLAPLGLERGVNALWSDGGLMYSPPYR